MSDETVLEAMEIDLEIAECGEILEAHGFYPTAEVVSALWDWAESLREAQKGGQQ